MIDSHRTHTPVLKPERILVSLATYNEVDNLRSTCRSDPPVRASLVTPDHRRQLARWNRPGCRRVASDSGPRPRDPSPEEARARDGDPGRHQFRDRERVRLPLESRRRFQPPAPVHPSLLAGMDDNDVMIGSRYVAGGGVEGEFGLKRKLMSRGDQLVRSALARAPVQRQ